MTKASIFIITYSTVDSKTFQSVLQYKNIIEQYSREHQIHVGLVGTKSDLTHLRQVPRTEAQSLATINNWIYSECSAAYDINVQSIFHNMLRAGRGNMRFNRTRKLPDKQIHRKTSFLNKFSSQFMRRRSCSKPVDTSNEPIQKNVAKTSLTSITSNVRNITRRRSYSVTTMI